MTRYYYKAIRKSYSFPEEQTHTMNVRTNIPSVSRGLLGKLREIAERQFSELDELDCDDMARTTLTIRFKA